MFGLDSLFSGFATSEDAFRNVSESLAQFAAAPAVARRCVYAVVLSTREADLQEFRPAFMESDKDGDGVVSRKDLVAAFAWASGLSLVDPNLLFSAADVDNRGSLDFRKFAAACLYGRMAPLDHWLAEQAFVSLDKDRDGLLSTYEVMNAFGFLPAGLPSFRRFSRDEWTRCMLGAVGNNEVYDLVPKKSVQIEEGDEKQTLACDSLGGLIKSGILGGCRMKRSHRRQGSHFESVEDMDIDMDNIQDVEEVWAQTHSPSSRNAAATNPWNNNHHDNYAPGAGLSSPSYVPRSRF